MSGDRDEGEAERFAQYARRAHRERMRDMVRLHELERDRPHATGADDWLAIALVWIVVLLLAAAVALPVVAP